MTAAGWMRALPNGKRISALGFGCSSLWAKPGFDDERAQDILVAANDGGINHFDTSPSYGEGTGERRLARFLKGRDATSFVVSTKVGNNLIEEKIQRGFDRGLIEKSFLASLKRLGLDHVDVLYLHGPSVEDLQRDDVSRFFEDQKRAGRISYSGVETTSIDVLRRLTQAPIDVVMPHFNVANQKIGSLVSEFVSVGKTVFSGTILAQMKFDLSTFIPTNRQSFWYLLRMAKNDSLFWWRGPALARKLQKTGRSPREAAIAFVVDHPHITSGLFGSSNPRHVAQNARTARDVATLNSQLHLA
jgi:aryl-alcohol dehydrogenase-like predicted oxidoreductase